MSDVLITGPPRSGTTLACYLLNAVPNVVALHEPMQVRELVELREPADRVRVVARFIEETRHSLLRDRTAMSRHIEGRTPQDPFSASPGATGLRTLQTSRGTINLPKELSPDFTLCIKHPQAFTAVLGSLTAAFPCYAIVRNPLATLASWNTIDFKPREGRVPVAERLDPVFASELSRITDRHDRQICCLSWMFEQYRTFLPAGNVLRYEDIVTTRGRTLEVIVPGALGLDAALVSKNGNDLYDRQLMRDLCKRLSQSNGAFWELYSKNNMEELLACQS